MREVGGFRTSIALVCIPQLSSDAKGQQHVWLYVLGRNFNQTYVIQCLATIEFRLARKGAGLQYRIRGILLSPIDRRDSWWGLAKALDRVTSFDAMSQDTWIKAQYTLFMPLMFRSTALTSVRCRNIRTELLARAHLFASQKILLTSTQSRPTGTVSIWDHLLSSASRSIQSGRRHRCSGHQNATGLCY